MNQRQQLEQQILRVNPGITFFAVVLTAIVVIQTSCKKSNVDQGGYIRETPNGLIKVPLARQATNYTCGVAALQSLLYYYGEEWRQDRLASELKADSIEGTNYRNIVKFCQNSGYEVNIYRNLSIDSLKLFIDQYQPILLAIQAWSENPANYAGDLDDGHYVICIGYDKNSFYFMDPSTLGNYTYIPNNEFVSRWHDIDQQGIYLQNFGMMIKKANPAYDPDKILKME